uniref:Uncharacterized protein n=1 Tax=Sparus aurata TaxID=8175 RepID=A0A671U438_SPAAU
GPHFRWLKFALHLDFTCSSLQYKAEHQFLCSICLDVFTDPVAIPCGHNFCETYIFNTRTELKQQVSKPGESCLVCLASYCVTHLEPHLTKSGLKGHQLIDPVENLEGRMCTKHNKLLELFCKTNQMCVCMLCTVLDHKGHSVVLLKEEYKGKKAELGKKDAEIQQIIQKRRLKIQEMKRSVELSKKDADREIAAGVQVFSALKESVERSQAELIDTIKEKQRQREKQAKCFIKELEQEISELEKRSSEVEQLSQSEDHLHLVQSFPSLNTINISEVTKRSPLHICKLFNLFQSFPSLNASIRPPSYEGTVVRAVNQLEETLSKQMKKLLELKRVQQYAVDFLCSICLDVFTDPVTIPCGHNFCKTCITQHWSVNALKSCLVCLASDCETHLEPHLTAKQLKRHQLIDPVENLEGRMCTKHDKLLELFCKTDQMCVCMLCTVLDHQGHSVVPLKEEYEGKKVELGKTDAEIQQMIQKRRLKIQEMKRSVELSKKDADREIAAGVQVFSALKESVERSQAELIDTIKEKQRETEKQAEGFIKELQQEISELEERSSEVEQLSQSEDHLHLLQSSPSLNAAPPTKDWTGVSIRPPSYEGTVVRAVNQLEETLSNQMKKVELKRVQQYAVDVTLDPDTAHPKLILSDDGKQVSCGYVEKKLPDNPERFDPCIYVIAKQSFSSGRFYYEVQVKGKTHWTLGVARELINRKGVITQRPQDGYWTIGLRNKNEYYAPADPSIRLSLKRRPEKVGVFVDYEEGLVSFYDFDAAALIYSFTGCCFTQKLYPFFSPCVSGGGKNSAPLMISPVSETF